MLGGGGEGGWREIWSEVCSKNGRRRQGRKREERLLITEVETHDT